jgi:hypothetical protein
MAIPLTALAMDLSATRTCERPVDSPLFQVVRWQMVFRYAALRFAYRNVNW